MINTRGNEWDPTPTPDGRFLYFTADSRQGGKGRSDIWVSEKIRGEWQLPTNLGESINSYRDETIDNVTVDGTTLLLSGNFKGSLGEFDIYLAEKDSAEWKSLTHLPHPINTQYHEESGCLTADGKALLFTSDRPGGIGPFVRISNSYYHGNLMGNMDIYVSVKQSDGSWGEPINLGPTINTPYAERSVFLHPDGKTLYFSSDGHPGLGRLDVFKSVRLNDTSWTEWSEPVNLGKEINSANDDWGYEVDISGETAFFAGNNYVIGYGGWDIYSISLPNKARPEQVVRIRGKVTDLEGNPISSVIKWEDLETGEIVGTLKSDPRDGYYFIALKPGRLYGYYAEKQGYYSSSKHIDLRNNNDITEINENIVLALILELQQKKQTVQINNIFFDFDKSDLKKESFPELNRLVELLKTNKQVTIKIEGHTDNIGTIERNVELSKQRANAVKEYLIANNIAANRITVTFFGALHPIAPNDTESNRAKNRRVNIVFQN
jgi:outer membrane protein OmpA-like peptidoglycan-associated protein